MYRAYKNKPLSARQLLRYGKSQRPSHTEKYLHESEKDSQQNLHRSTIKREQFVQMLHKGGKLP